MEAETKTGKVYRLIFELLQQNPNGLRWHKLLEDIQTIAPELHPKTINGCIWKLVEKYPDRVYKPEKGLFRLKA